MKVKELCNRLFAAGKMPMILQVEAAECGLACLAMVAWFYDQRRTLSELRQVFSVSMKGTNLKAIMDMADNLGLSTRPLRLEIEELRQLEIPSILHWNLQHFVVLSKVGKDWVEIYQVALV